MNWKGYEALIELRNGDIPFRQATASEQEGLRQLQELGLVETRGLFIKRATLTERGRLAALEYLD